MAWTAAFVVAAAVPRTIEPTSDQGARDAKRLSGFLTTKRTRTSVTASAPVEMWASLAIVVMWLAVLFDAIYGPGHRDQRLRRELIPRRSRPR